MTLTFAELAFSQGTVSTFPSKPVVMVIATAPGGPVDQEARIYAPRAVEYFRQPFIVDTKPGAAGTVAAGYVFKTAPDGYTLLVVTGNFAVLPSFYKDLPFDTLKDFSAVSLMSNKPTVLLAHLGFSPKSFADYLAYAKANPGKINFGTSGAGSISHLAGAWMHSVTNTKVTFIHYKGAATIDLVAGRLDVVPAALIAGLPLVKSGKVRAIAVMSEGRSSVLEGVPTVAEHGIPGYDYTSWFGLVAHSATPAAIVNKLSDGFANVAKAPEVIAKLALEGGVTVGSTPAQFQRILNLETARWQKLVQETGIKLEE